MSASGASVRVIGAQRLEATLKRAADELDEMPVGSTAQTVLSTARKLAPRVSGRLAGSLRAEIKPHLVRVSSGSIYAPPIHFGWPRRNIRANPFLERAAKGTEPVWLRANMQYVGTTISKVRGA